MIEKVSVKNKEEFEQILKKLWQNATLKSCKQDAKTTAQFIYKKDGKVVGFITCSIKREYVPGCHTRKVGYLEGIYVLFEYRNQNIGSKLINQFEIWAKKKGCKELASDLEIDNEASLQFHNKMGYEIAEKTIHLVKNINN